MLNEFLEKVSDQGILVLNDSEGFKRDWTPLLALREFLGQTIGKPSAVIKPKSVEEIAKVIKLANNYNACVVPYAGGSSVVGGAYHNSCTILDLSELNKVLELNEDDLTVTVEAGIKIKDLEDKLNSKGYTLDYHPQSFFLATIGGAIAHKGSGSHSSSNIEELLLWIEVVLPNGEIVRIGPDKSVRNSMGPGMLSLFIGSEGTLGVITKAKLKIKPLANYHKDLAFYFNSIDDAIKFAKEYTVRLPPPYRVVVHDSESANYMLGLPYFISLVRVRGYDQELVDVEERLIKNIALKYGGKEGEKETVRKWRDVFARNYEANFLSLVQSGYFTDTLDLAGSWSIIPKIYKELRENLYSINGVKSVLSRFTHLYTNGTCLYVMVILRQDPEVLLKVWETAAKVVIKWGGTTSHHHGVGFLKKPWILREKEDEVRLYKMFKLLLDSKGIMNPGKLVD
ncbi:alkyldihydroxyacetonephosphate synthase [Sulfolobus acidocaldarius SUSAZ]|nr:alkyldihydroxyacetonephosphate synthase [Sulfolobus acidocaldarius SUSAZ]